MKLYHYEVVLVGSGQQIAASLDDTTLWEVGQLVPQQLEWSGISHWEIVSLEWNVSNPDFATVTVRSGLGPSRARPVQNQ